MELESKKRRRIIIQSILAKVLLGSLLKMK